MNSAGWKPLEISSWARSDSTFLSRRVSSVPCSFCKVPTAISVFLECVYSRLGGTLLGVVSAFTLVVFSLGCTGGQDPVAEGMAKFPLLRHDLEQARQLLLALKQADGITGFEVGPRYDERPDKVIFNYGRAVLYREVLSEKKIVRQVELEQLERFGHRMPFKSIVLDAAETFRVSMYSGRNSDLGLCVQPWSPKTQALLSNFLERYCLSPVSRSLPAAVRNALNGISYLLGVVALAPW